MKIRGLKGILALQILWLALVCGLGAWWGSLVLTQAERIAALETAAGRAAEGQSQLFHTHRMLLWEGSTFLGVLVASAAVLVWLYLRDAMRNRAIHAFFASVTHELRTPLTSIRLQAESIADAAGAAPAAKPFVGRLLEDTLRLEGMVERTLELARVEGGGPVHTEALSIRPWLERRVAAWRAAHGDRAEITVEAQDLAVMADPAAIEIILKNLFENTLRHSKRERARIRIRSTEDGEFASLLFSDDGGAYQGDVRQLGKLFQKGQGSQGAGVGLYLVRTLMNRMGGQAQFEARRGVEGGFVVSLRFRKAAAHG